MRTENPYTKTFFGLVDNLGKAFLEFLLPLRCVGCEQIGQLICARCEAQSNFLQTQHCPAPNCQKAALLGFTHENCSDETLPERLVSIFPYRGAVRGAIMQLKYEQVLMLQEFLQRKISKFVNEEEFYVPENFTILPMPLHPAKERKRTFNQSELLSRIIANNFNLAVEADLLKRVRATKSQTKMKDKEGREQNVEGVFEVKGKKDLSRKNILLVDDVWTTGATAREAVRTLRESGAREVWVFTLARG